MTYDVDYKLAGSLFWKKVKRVKGDVMLPNDTNPKSRVLILEDETRLEIPMEGTLFKFSNGRFLLIKKNMEQELGQKIPVNSILDK